MKRFAPRLPRWIAVLMLTAACNFSAVAQVTISALAFAPAQPGRTHMDIGGVWNGTSVTAVQGGTLTNGDIFRFTYTNTGATTVFEFKPIFSFPATFTPVGTPNIISSGCLPLTNLDYSAGFGNGTPMTLLALPANNGTAGGFDMPAGCSFTIRVQGMMSASATAGSVSVTANYQSAAVDGGATTLGTSPQSTTVPVKNGLSTITKSPNNQTRAVGQAASWPSGLSVLNTGTGGLFNVTLNESAISGMSLTSLSATGATCAGSLCTLPYLAPSAQMIGSAAATVTSCQNITNTVSTTDVTGATAKSTSAQVTLDLLQPLLNFAAPTINVPYTGTQSVSIPLSNTSTGPARPFSVGSGIQLQTNLNGLGVVVSNVAANWSYSGGTFSYTGGGSGGTIAGGASTTLTFDVAAANACTFAPGALVVTARYSDDCGNQFAVPTKVGGTTLGSGAPSVTLNKGSSIPVGTSTYPRQVVGTPAAYGITANLTNFANIQGANIVITDVLPAGITGVSFSAPVGSVACSGACTGGSTLTWTIPKSALGAGPNAAPVLTINYTAPNDVCLAGTFLNNTASYSGFTSALPANSCPLNSSSTQSTLLTLAPGLGTSQYFNVTNPSSTTFETGLADAAPFNVTAKPNEGDLIPVNAVYSFGTASAGVWAGSTFNDNFGGFPAGSAVLSSNTLQMQIDTGSGSFVGVPAGPLAANVVCGAGSLAGNNCSGSLTINLGFLATPANFGTPTVAAPAGVRRIRLDYKLAMTDAALAAGNISRVVSQIGTLTIAGDTAGCTAAGNTVYRQGDSYTIERARPVVGLTLPNALDVCQPTNLPLSIGNSANNKINYNLLTTLLSGGATDWRYTVPQTPVYGGLYSTLALTHAANAGTSPTWAHTNALDPLTAAGTINAQVFLRAGVANGATVAGLQARTDYDDNQTAGGVRDFALANGVLATSNVPVVRKGNLVSTVSPQTIFATGASAQWRVFLTNTGNGTAYNAQFADTLPAKLVPDAAGTNALNAATSCAPQANCNVAISGAGQTMTFNLGDIPAGETRSVFVKVTISNSPLSCSPVAGAAGNMAMSWGCGAPFEVAQNFTTARPTINFPAAEMTAGHDSGNTVCVLCGASSARIVVRNTGGANLSNLTVAETLYTATQGTDYIAGTSEYSTDGITWLPAGNPVLSGGAYRWTSAQVPPLAQLWPQSQSTPSQPYQVFIRFGFSTNALTATAANPKFDVQTTGSMACGTVIDTLAQPFNLTVQKPSLTVAKTGINRTVAGGLVGTGSFVEGVFGGAGDLVEWRVVVVNNGTAPASNVRLLDVFPNTGSTSMTVVAGPACGASVSYPFTITNNVASANLCTLPATAGSNTHTYYLRETLGNANCNAPAPQGTNTARISYGCTAALAGAQSEVNGLAGMSDLATITRQPDLSAFNSSATSQQFFQESNGRIRVELNLTNTGGTAQNIVFSPVLSIGGVQGGWARDTTTPARLYGTAVSTSAGCVAPPLTSNAVAANYTCTSALPNALFNAVTTTGTATAPVFTTTGVLRNGDTAKLVFYVLPNNYDTLQASTFPDLAAPEGAAYDTVALGALQLVTTVDYQNTCAQALSTNKTSSTTSFQPDLDIFLYNAANSALDSNRIIASTVPETFNFRVRNVGPAGSIANQLSAQFQLGNGWGTPTLFQIISSTGTGFGAPITCTLSGSFYSCPITATAQLASNQEYVVRITATPIYAANASLLMKMTRAAGEITGFSSATSGFFYAQDAGQYRTVGTLVTKTSRLVNGSSQPDSQSAGLTNLLVGEEVLYGVIADFWGVGAEPITDISYTDSYFKTGADAHNALVFVSASAATSTNLNGLSAPLPTPVSFISPTPRITAIATSITSGEGRFSRDYVFRVVNHASISNTAPAPAGMLLRNNFGVAFTYGGQYFRSNAGDDGFTGGVSSFRLHSDTNIPVKVPNVTLTKQICNTTVNTTCNLTTGTGFANTASGDASHDYVYRLVISNAANAAPAFDLDVTDTLPNNKLSMVAGTADAIVNARNSGGAETGNSGTFVAGAGGSVSFNAANVTTLPAGAGPSIATMAQLDAGQSIILTYKVTGIAANITGGDLVTNTANLTYSTLPGPFGGPGTGGVGQTVTQSAGTPTPASGLGGLGERTYATLAQATVSFSRVYGRVYLDNNHNSSFEASDGNYVGTAVGATPTPLLCAQLVQAGSLVGSMQLTAAGTFSFANAPSGSYDVRIVPAITGPACPALPTAALWVPATFGYIPTENAAQTITFTVNAITGAAALNFGLFQGTKISGKVFLDNTGVTTANDRLFNAQDVGLSGVRVCARTAAALNCAAGAGLLDSVLTDGSGDYVIWAPLAASPATVFVVNAGTGRISTGANVTGTVLPNGVGTSVGGTAFTYAYSTGIDWISFSAAFGAAYGTLNFGEINPSVFTTDNAATVPAGSVRYYPHSFTAATSGSVSFAVSNIATPANAGWSEQIYLDANCDGAIDAGDTLLTTATTLLAGQTVCILVKENVPATAGVGTANAVTVTATFTAANTTLVPVQIITHTDTTTVTAANAGSLELVKSVRNVTAGGTFAPTNTGKAGDILEYRITFKNTGATSLNNVRIQDATPPYTTFQNAQLGGVLPNALIACNKNTPVNPLPAAAVSCATVQTAGSSGGVIWTFAGSLAPGQMGEVLLRVQVDQ